MHHSDHAPQCASLDQDGFKFQGFSSPVWRACRQPLQCVLLQIGFGGLEDECIVIDCMGWERDYLLHLCRDLQSAV